MDEKSQKKDKKNFPSMEGVTGFEPVTPAVSSKSYLYAECFFYSSKGKILTSSPYRMTTF